MDVNGTRFHLLLGADWGRCMDERGRALVTLWSEEPPADHAVVYDEKGGEILLRPEAFRFPPVMGEQPLEVTTRRGAARDRFGNWYWVDTVPNRILVNSSGTQATTLFWSIEKGTAPRPTPASGDFRPVASPPIGEPVELAGVVVTEDHYLLVGIIDPAGFLVFDLQAGGPPDQILWPSGVDFEPFDMAPRPEGGAFVLDRVNRRLWELDRHFMVVSRATTGVEPPGSNRAFEPADGQEGSGTEPSRFGLPMLDDAVDLRTDTEDEAPGPVAVEAFPDGTVLVLFRRASGPSNVRPYRDGTALGPAVSTSEPRDDVYVAGHDMALVPSIEQKRPELRGQLFVVDRSGNQAFEFSLYLTGAAARLELEPRYYPMRLFGGKALASAGGKAYYDFADRWVPLAEQHRRRFVDRATILSEVFDGREPGCVWHRLMIDACIPPETSVTVRSAAADDPDEIKTPRWIKEPGLYPRTTGPELPFVPGDPMGAYRTWELLFQKARGRYLRLRLDLSGNQRATPRIRALRAHYPRFSYLERYLPGVYRDDRDSASFLDRFLANLEGMATGIEDRVASVQGLFDGRTVPSAALQWLGSWFELAMDPAWTEAKRRLLIGHAMEFFQWRGTVRGLQTALALALDDDPEPTLFADDPDACVRRVRIVELYQTKLTPGVALGDPTQAASAPPGGRRWRPADGTQELDRRYAEALQAAGLPADETTRFPATEPTDSTDLPDPVPGLRAAVWRSVAQRSLGVIPTARPEDLRRWHDFLERRYGRISELNPAYQRTGRQALASFGQAELPTQAVPERDPALTDWFQFQTVVLPSARTAHRFRVLLPVAARTRMSVDPVAFLERQAGLRDLAERIVQVEKPAHTVFDVKFYWDAFRVGEARLGLDTLVDLGGRSPHLLTGAVLGRAHLGESVLATPFPSPRPPLIDTTGPPSSLRTGDAP